MPFKTFAALASAMVLLTAACGLAEPGSGHLIEAVPKARTDSSLMPGEYITEKGWGRLLLKEQGDALMFSLETITGEDACDLNGAVRSEVGIATEDNGNTCTIKFSGTSRGIDIAATTPAECKAFCGYNGNFEAPYLRVKSGCGRDDLDRTRDVFRRLYDGKAYKAALVTLSPVLANCLPTLEWEDEGAIRNDLAGAQYKSGLYAECLATLDKYAEDARKDDDEVVSEWSPVLADRHLEIVRAARTNISLCSEASSRKSDKEES